LLWFVAGEQSFRNGKADYGMLSQSMGVIVLLVTCGWAIVRKEWLGLAFTTIVLGVELRLIRRYK